MSKPLLVIISGLPCTGKTMLGKKIAEHFCLPFINKDTIKESLFDTLGIKDREWSKKLGVASYGVLYRFLESLLAASCSVIVESNFKAEIDSKIFGDLRKKYDFDLLQLLCKTEGNILFERFKKRWESGERHEGHVDDQNYVEFKDLLMKGDCQPLNLEGKVLNVDTTHFASLDYGQIFDGIQQLISL